MPYRQLLSMNLPAFIRNLKSVVAFHKQHRPSYQRNAAPRQCVNRKDVVPSTVVNESLSVSEEIGRVATSYIPSDWRLFTYISISKEGRVILPDLDCFAAHHKDSNLDSHL
ncbi:hypothetical protein J6590_068820 [Homalodisca vitripennis]|nr:hypothetical protein J6590_068820 [Homalodisca vitripennis]